MSAHLRAFTQTATRSHVPLARRHVAFCSHELVTFLLLVQAFAQSARVRLVSEAEFHKNNPDLDESSPDFTQKRRDVVWSALYHGNLDAALTEKGLTQLEELEGEADAIVEADNLQVRRSL